MSTVKERFPYQFSGDNIGLSMTHGWEPLFEKLCEDIDALLSDDNRKFHWSQLKEKFGSARFHWSIDYDGAPTDLQKKIAALVNEAQAKTQQMCIVCGQPGKLDRSEPYVLVLCDEHIRQRADNKLPNFWCKGYK
jgi:hypothetical protein